MAAAFSMFCTWSWVPKICAICSCASISLQDFNVLISICLSQVQAIFKNNRKHQQHYNSRSHQWVLFQQLSHQIVTSIDYLWNIIIIVCCSLYGEICESVNLWSLVLILWRELSQSCMIIVFNFVKIRDVQSYTCNLI